MKFPFKTIIYVHHQGPHTKCPLYFLWVAFTEESTRRYLWMVSACKEWIQMHSDWCVQSIPQKLSFILLHIIAPQVSLKTAHSIHWSIIILSLCHADAKNIGKKRGPSPPGPSHAKPQRIVTDSCGLSSFQTSRLTTPRGPRTRTSQDAMTGAVIPFHHWVFSAQHRGSSNPVQDMCSSVGWNMMKIEKPLNPQPDQPDQPVKQVHSWSPWSKRPIRKPIPSPSPVGKSTTFRSMSTITTRAQVMYSQNSPIWKTDDLEASGCWHWENGLRTLRQCPLSDLTTFLPEFSKLKYRKLHSPKQLPWAGSWMTGCYDAHPFTSQPLIAAKSRESEFPSE